MPCFLLSLQIALTCHLLLTSYFLLMNSKDTIEIALNSIIIIAVGSLDKLISEIAFSWYAVTQSSDAQYDHFFLVQSCKRVECQVFIFYLTVLAVASLPISSLVMPTSLMTSNFLQSTPTQTLAPLARYKHVLSLFAFAGALTFLCYLMSCINICSSSSSMDHLRQS